MNVSSSTISGNRAGNFGDIDNGQGTMNVTNSTVAYNPVTRPCADCYPRPAGGIGDHDGMKTLGANACERYRVTHTATFAEGTEKTKRSHISSYSPLCPR